MKILITGATGYIASHTIVRLIENNIDVVGIDNFSNSDKSVLDKIKTITGKDIKFYEGDVKDKELLSKIFKENDIDMVIHFAGFKAVGESVSKPLKYYDNNLISTINLLEVMNDFNIKKIIFSSSATVYGKPKSLPIKEDFETHTTNPYGTTKLFIEQILTDLYNSDNSWSITILRYFNPIGAHPSGLIGEDPKDIPNNLMPYINRVATKQYDKLNIFGNDYDTKDGTGVRDYIHVMDLANGHVCAAKNMKNSLNIYNLGTGNGFSVLELVETYKRVNNVDVPYQIVERRPGDIDSCFADASLAEKEIGFKTEYTIEDMCRDAYNFVTKNM